MQPISVIRRIAGLALLCACSLEAQTVALEPAALARVPVGQRYWQQVVVEFAHDDAPAEEVLALSLPTGAFIPDQDNDGRLNDEVRLVYAPAAEEEPVFFVSSATVEGRIGIGSVAAAGAGGRLYIQFPVNGFSGADGDSLFYGPVEFADGREADIAAGPAVEIVGDEVLRALGSLGVVRFAAPLAEDVFGEPQGFSFPDFDQVLLETLPDLVFDGGVSTASSLVGFGDGDDSNDTVFRFFFSPDPVLVQVDDETAIPALSLEGQAYSETEAGPRAVRLLTRDLPVGTYYLYVTSDLTGGRPLGRSAALVVSHEPRVTAVSPDDGDITLDSGGLFGLDGVKGGASGTRYAIDFSVVDYDDSATVHLFYSPDADLRDLALQSAIQFVAREDGAVLEGATPLTPPAGIGEGAGPFVWDILEPVQIPEGDYFIYAMASDGDRIDLWRSSSQVRVRHAPFLRLDPLEDRILVGADTVYTGGVRPQRFVSVTWGRSGIDGDGDLDGDAQIDFFWSTVPVAGAGAGLALPGGEEDLLALVGQAAGHVGGGIGEDADGREADRFVWDLWAGGSVPAAGPIHYLYGIIADRDTQRLAQMNGGRPNDAASRLVFVHRPHIRPLQPLGDIRLDRGRRGRVAWEDMDVDDDARIRVVLSALELDGVGDYAALAAGPAWVLNSADGFAEALVDTLFDISEDSPLDRLDIDLGHLQRGLGSDGPPPAGEYRVYIAAEDGPAFGASSLAWKAPGRVTIEDGAAEDAFAVRLAPEAFTLGAGGTAQPFEVRVDAGGEAVDLVRLTLRLAANLEVADQDGAAGLQPFRVGADYDAAKLVPTESVLSEDGTRLLRFEYFEPTAASIPGLDGSRALGIVEILGGAAEGEAFIELVDVQAGGVSQLLDGGVPVLEPGARVLASGNVVAGRARVVGTLALEGRAAVPSRVAVSLRPWASFAPLEDSLFAATNDVDPEDAGIQVELGENGAFELLEVPTGRHDIFFSRPGYLDAWAIGLSLLPGAEIVDIVPQSPGGGGRMLAGDVAGYRDAAGESMPDNEVTLADWDFVAALFGRASDAETGEEAAVDPRFARADITGDGAVDVQDLALVGANFLRRGPDPVFKAGVAQAVWPDTATAADGVFTAVVPAEALGGIQAFEIETAWDEDAWEWLAPQGPAAWLQAQNRSGGKGLIAFSRLGRDAQRPEKPLQLRWRARGKTDADAPAVVEARAVAQDGRLLRAGGEAALPATPDLGQNFPNPFNPETHIRLRLPQAVADAHLEVFNALGQTVVVLWRGPLDAGSHVLRWDGRTQTGVPVGGGVYFYRWRAAGQTQVKRMVLVR